MPRTLRQNPYGIQIIKKDLSGAQPAITVLQKGHAPNPMGLQSILFYFQTSLLHTLLMCTIRYTFSSSGNSIDQVFL